ncbi:MAG: hypothetical protein F6K24_08765, partial [Okeania sp. SIO2D1]|nr:hypothetical protein [Okeania sp. SIO2D1]
MTNFSSQINIATFLRSGGSNITCIYIISSTNINVASSTYFCSSGNIICINGTCLTIDRNISTIVSSNRTNIFCIYIVSCSNIYIPRISSFGNSFNI